MHKLGDRGEATEYSRVTLPNVRRHPNFLICYDECKLRVMLQKTMMSVLLNRFGLESFLSETLAPVNVPAAGRQYFTVSQDGLQVLDSAAEQLVPSPDCT